jgi:hypothetical protein
MHTNNKLASQNFTCATNVAQYAKFSVSSAQRQDNGQYALVGTGHVPVITDPFDGGVYGGFLPAYMGSGLIAACAKPTNVSGQLLCGDMDLLTPCPPALPCEFNEPGFVLLGNPVAVGNGSMQLGVYNFGQSGLTPFSACAQESFPGVVSQTLANTQIYASSAAKAHRKATLALGTLFAVAFAFGQV